MDDNFPYCQLVSFQDIAVSCGITDRSWLDDERKVYLTPYY
jgi:hypothetical protein